MKRLYFVFVALYVLAWGVVWGLENNRAKVVIVPKCDTTLVTLYPEFSLFPADGFVRRYEATVYRGYLPIYKSQGYGASGSTLDFEDPYLAKLLNSYKNSKLSILVVEAKGKRVTWVILKPENMSRLDGTLYDCTEDE